MPPARAAAEQSPVPAALTVLSTMALAALLAWSAAHGDLPQFQGKAMDVRLACAPVAVAVVPAAWWLADRLGSRRIPFPYTPVLLVVLSLVIDLAGNATRLYDTVEYFDDAVHVVNPVLLVGALALVLSHTGLPRWATWAVAFGAGCAGNILWEIAEYTVMARMGASSLYLSLPDTLSDQAWGLVGAAVGAAAPVLSSGAVPAAAPHPEAPRVPDQTAAPTLAPTA